MFSRASLVSSELIASGTYDNRLSMADGTRFADYDLNQPAHQADTTINDDIKRTKTELEPVCEQTLFTGNTLESPVGHSPMNAIDLNDYHVRSKQKQRR